MIQNETPKSPSVIPKAHMTLAEKKRMEWEKEKHNASSNWDPWGKPGCGARNIKTTSNPSFNTPPSAPPGPGVIPYQAPPSSRPGTQQFRYYLLKNLKANLIFS